MMLNSYRLIIWIWQVIYAGQVYYCCSNQAYLKVFLSVYIRIIYKKTDEVKTAVFIIVSGIISDYSISVSIKFLRLI